MLLCLAPLAELREDFLVLMVEHLQQLANEMSNVDVLVEEPFLRVRRGQSRFPRLLQNIQTQQPVLLDTGGHA